MAIGSGAMEDLVMSMSRKLWRHASVFLTGHTGCQGGWLSGEDTAAVTRRQIEEFVSAPC